jgi:hypothetical protein
MGTKNNPGDYDCYAKAGLDEPIFTLRANDPLAPALVRVWCTLARGSGVAEEKVMEAFRVAADMDRWWRQQHVAPRAEILNAAAWPANAELKLPGEESKR